MASADLRAELECSVCLNIYTDPVTLKCGHNFCRVCIDRGTQGGSGGYSCPECRQKFQDRPTLQRNITLCNIVGTFHSAEPFFCTHCVDSPVPAVRSCLLCEVSLCDKHLRVHKKSPEHILTDPTSSLESRKCSVHKKILEYYCTEDNTCICVYCIAIGGHKGHEMKSLDEASGKKKETLRNVLQKLVTTREEMEERVRSLLEHRRKVEEEAAGDTERVTALFIDLRRRLEVLEKRVLREISGRAERDSMSIVEMIRDLEIKKDELSRKMRHIEELCNMMDPLTVLQESDTGDLSPYTDLDHSIPGLTGLELKWMSFSHIGLRRSIISHSSASPCVGGCVSQQHSSPASDTFTFISLLLPAMASADLRAELECSVCLNIYTDPVNLKCGHNFCRVCIDRVLDTQGGSGGYSCPECRAKFQARPALQRNITLCNIAGTFHSAPPGQEQSGVFCTYCVDSPVPAVRSCLLCEVSLCDKHLRVHKKSPEHILTDPTSSLESRKCSVHKKILEYYCTEDDTCVCMSCFAIGEHTGHKMKSLDEASGKKKETLRNVLQKLVTTREKTEERVRSLQEHRRKVEEEAAGDTERVTALFIDLRRRLEVLEKRVLREISGRAERDSMSIVEMIRDLEIKKDELSRKMRHIEELCNMTDPLTVLQESDTGDLCDTEDGDDEDRERHDKLLHDGGGLDVAGILHTGLSDIITEVNVYFPIQEAADILLDVNTADNNLHISDDRKTVSWSDIKQNRPETPERFQYWPQVLSSRRFSSGRHYWEVDVGGSDNWIVGMCYPSIDRRGGKSGIGYNKKSWGLFRNSNQYWMRHDNKEIPLPANISSNRVRIYLDYEAGRISFYDLCDPIRHLHTFTTTFTEPLHAVLWVRRGYIKICGGNRGM
ncbi:LOW QUALITY PROTEIN: E3 ubiquitin-protein ligase TRIM7-like [Mantella aurantiaca]